MNRRGFLKLIPSSLLITGCTEDTNESPQKDSITIGSIGIRNLHDQEHDVEVWVFKNDRRVFNKSVEVEAKSGNVMGSEILAKRKFVDESGDYDVYARVDNGERKHVNLSEYGRSQCYVVIVRIGSSGVGTMGIIPDAYECSNTDS